MGGDPAHSKKREGRENVDIYEWMAVFGSLILGAVVLYAIYAGRRPKG